jgi:uncharacterized protein
VDRAAFLRGTGVAVATAALPRFAEGAESAIVLRTVTGNLQGTLQSVQAAPAPVVLIVAGSGPTDRDGNSGLIHSDAYKLLATALAERGIASVRYDKRGVGESAAAATSEQELRFETYIDDVAAWIRQLRADRRFSKIAVAGHSEGSLLGIVAVQRSPADALVSLEGAGRPAPAILREQLKGKVPPDLYASAEKIIARLQQGHTVPNVPGDLFVLFRPSVQPYLISWFGYDPAVEIAKVRIPVTIVQGTADVQVTMTDAQALLHADPSARFVTIDGMNHMLKYAPNHASTEALIRGYEDPALPVDPRAVDAVAAAAA